MQPLEDHVTSSGGTVVSVVRGFKEEAVPQTLVFDLSPDEAGQSLGIAIKRDGDSNAYAFPSESYRVPTLCLPHLVLPHTEYDVIVRAYAGQITHSARFVLRNDGRLTRDCL